MQSKTLMINRGLQKFLEQSLAGIFFFALIWIFLYSVFAVSFPLHFLKHILHVKPRIEVLMAACAWFGLPLFFLVKLWRSENYFKPAKFLLFYSLGLLILGGIYIHFISPLFTNDFKIMWDTAIHYAVHGIGHVKTDQAQRSIFILYPLIKLFGAKLLLLKTVNLVQVLAIGLLGYRLLQHHLSHRAAQAFALVWLLSFEPFMATAIPSHDLWGLFLVMLALTGSSLLLNACRQSNRMVILFGSVLVGFVAALIEMQRGYGIIFLLANVIIFMYWSVQARRKISLGVVVSLLMVTAYVVTESLLDDLQWVVPKEARQQLNLNELGAGATSFSSGLFTDKQRFIETFIVPVKPEERPALIYSLIVSDWSEASVWKHLRMLEKRIAYLAMPGVQDIFYLNGVDPQRAYFSWFATRVSTFIVFVLALWAWVVLLRRKKINAISAIVLMFSGLMITIISLLMEVQPRYGFFMWLAAAFMIAEGFSGRFVREGASQSFSIRWFFIPTVSCLLMGLLLGWGLLKLSYLNMDDHIITGWTLDVVGVKDPANTLQRLRELQNTPSIALASSDGDMKSTPVLEPLSLELESVMPMQQGDAVLAKRKVCMNEHQKGLEFFVATSKATSTMHADFLLSLYQDDQPRWSMPVISNQKPKLVTVNLSQQTPCSMLTFKLSRQTRSKSLDTLQQSKVEIVFPRLLTTDLA